MENQKLKSLSISVAGLALAWVAVGLMTEQRRREVHMEDSVTDRLPPGHPLFVLATA